MAAAATGQVTVELVGDGVHLDDETVRAALTLAGGNAVLVTDAMAAAGMPDGAYDLGPQSVEVHNGVARLAGGGSIAGGTSHLLDQVGRHASAGLALTSLLEATARRPAAVIGLNDIGALEPGRRADLVVADATLAAVRVMRAGEWTEVRGNHTGFCAVPGAG